MKEVRNADGKLVATVEETTGTVVIVQRGCVTVMQFNSDGSISIVNTKNEVV